uniref:Ceramide synthase 3 n=1 Tax=Fundulus heteroclitus TaxID=8078 RepID=A0A3Q2UM55_FUNHE
MFETLYEWFWWDKLWLPAELSWADLEDKEGRVYAKASHLYVTVPYAFGFLLIRYLFERWIATPLAVSAGIRHRVHLRAKHNPILELYYTTHSRNPPQVRKINNNYKKKHTCQYWKRIENVALRQKPFVCITKCVFLLHFVHLFSPLCPQSMLESQYWYYILEMSFYGCLLCSVAFDVKRKDFKEQIIHHLATLILLSFSWCANFIRVGTLVMLVHDASDVLLESAKLFNYAKWEKTSQGLFVVFAVVFMVTRLIIFPFWLMHCTWVYPVDHYPAFFGYYFFNVMLVVLLFLHMFWAYLIFRMIRKFLDERSDNEEEEGQETSPTEDEDDEQHKPCNGLSSDAGREKNGCFNLSPPRNTCLSKTMS